MADKQTIDLGDVKIDDLFGASIPSAANPGSPQDNPLTSGIDLFSKISPNPLDPPQVSDAQKTYSSINLTGASDFDFPEVSSVTQTDADFMSAQGWQQTLENLRLPVLTLALLALAAVFFGTDIWEMLQSTDSGNLGFDSEPMISELEPDAGGASQQETAVPPAAPAAEDLTTINRELLGNPYWALPNRLQASEQPDSRISPAQEAKWRFGLNHQYTYQRYLATRQIRLSRSKGAAFLLFEALEQPKFWTRMEALFGLAEMGLKIDVNTVEKGIGGARSSLVANYFRRYLENRPTGGELYVLRQAIRVVDARARLVILQALAKLGGDMNQLYLIAASYDPSSSIQEWLQMEQNSLRISGINRQRYQTIIADYLSSGGQELGSAVVEELKVEELIETSILNEVQFFQELIDTEEETIVGPEDFSTDGFEALQ